MAWTVVATPVVSVSVAWICIDSSTVSAISTAATTAMRWRMPNRFLGVLMALV